MSISIIEDPHKNVELEFVMNGPIFDQGLPIPLTIKALEAVQGIVDKSYLVLAHKKRMSSHERSVFFLQSQGIEKGSLFTNLALAFTAAQPLLPIISDLGPTGVWEYTKEAFQFLKIVFEAKKRGEEVVVTQSGDGSIVNVNTGTQTITFNGPVYQIANSALPHYEYLAHQLDPAKVTDIRFGKGAQKDIFLDVADKTLFDLPIKVGEVTHDILCEIFEFDKYSSTGRVTIFQNQSCQKASTNFQS